MSKIIGIDLGTTNSTVANLGRRSRNYFKCGRKQIDSFYCCFTKEEKKRIVGQIAKRQSITNPEHMITSIKKRDGNKF